MLPHQRERVLHPAQKPFGFLRIVPVPAKLPKQDLLSCNAQLRLVDVTVGFS